MMWLSSFMNDGELWLSSSMNDGELWLSSSMNDGEFINHHIIMVIHFYCYKVQSNQYKATMELVYGNGHW